MRRVIDDRLRLLHGPYQAPRLHGCDRTSCLFRDCDVAVTSWTDAPISWPRCLPVGSKGHPSLLVNEELAHAVRMESAAAIMHWWGVSVGVAWRWQNALGVGRMDSPGSRRLILPASEKGAEALRGPELPGDQVERRRQTAIEQNLGRTLITGYHGRRWTDEEAALLGTMPDAEVARRTGFRENAVREKRPAARHPHRLRPAGGLPSPPRTEEDDQVLGSYPPEEAAPRSVGRWRRCTGDGACWGLRKEGEDRTRNERRDQVDAAQRALSHALTTEPSDKGL